jgi:sortase (surface protein transpeptidase)
VPAGRLDDWWDPAWDTAWWDPVWTAHGPADAAPLRTAASQPRKAAAAAPCAEPGIPASLPGASSSDVAGPATAVPAGPAAVPGTSPEAPVTPPWGQLLATTIGLRVTRRPPPAGIAASAPGSARQRGTRFRSLLRHPPGRRPHPACPRLARRPRFTARGSAVPARGPRFTARGPAVPARGPWFTARGPAVPARVLAVSMLGAGLLAVGAGTAGLLAAGGSPSPSARWTARPSPVPVPSGRTAAPAWLATVQQTARPVWLTVPAIGVRARLVDLGLNRNGTLQVPATTTVAGWFTGSPRPGAIGSAVIAGHVDSRTGPAVFFWLRTMRPGERIYVGRADGTLAVFTVTSVRMYPKDEFPTAAVYGPVPDAELRLITCGGIFDESLGSYLSNVVVYARLTGSLRGARRRSGRLCRVLA